MLMNDGNIMTWKRAKLDPLGLWGGRMCNTLQTMETSMDATIVSRIGKLRAGGRARGRRGWKIAGVEIVVLSWAARVRLFIIYTDMFRGWTYSHEDIR